MRCAAAHRRYEVYYPSGQCFTVSGALGVHLAPDGTVLGPMLVAGRRGEPLDPRAVVLREGIRVYDPRQVIIAGGWFDPTIDAWLAEHPEWPAILE